MIDLAPLLQKKLTPRCEGKFLFQRKDDMFSWKNSGTTSPSYDSWNCPGNCFNYKGFGMKMNDSDYEENAKHICQHVPVPAWQSAKNGHVDQIQQFDN